MFVGFFLAAKHNKETFPCITYTVRLNISRVLTAKNSNFDFEIYMLTSAYDLIVRCSVSTLIELSVARGGRNK